MLLACNWDDHNICNSQLNFVSTATIHAAKGTQYLHTITISLGCTDGAIRLADGPTSYQGRVEVCLNQEWGSVCDSNWTTTDANVACRQLGFSKYSEWYFDMVAMTVAPKFQPRFPLSSFWSLIVCKNWMVDRTENEATQLSYKSNTVHAWWLKLTNLRYLLLCGQKPPSYISSVWKKRHVYHKFAILSQSDAEAQQGSSYGTGRGRILVQNVDCDGSEAALLNCSNDSNIPCSRDSEVAVFCQVNCEF